ncbi:MAG: thiamine phosphate synthase [Bryobacteraceae bacterium]
MIELKLAPFYPVLDTALWTRAGIPVLDACEAILEGGARLLQLRHKGHFSRQLFADAQRMARMCAAAGALFVIDDRADVAALLNAALHVGQDDLRPRDVRKILPADLAIGFSTHNEMQLREAAEEPADYLALGPIFQTASKENPDPVVGLKELARLRAMVTRPLVAIGGITRQSALEAMQAGADSVAVIGDLVPEEHTKLALRKRTEEWVQLLKT